ncbi:CoA ester lyase [Nocardioides sp. SOB77]|uniref:CoA ester lyase n=1 Tax=Nocardioides oceani TaxID=3058369 RepID=A0ABT8FFQ2_9ACTN|nr:CoA ester lyase [Nocardioides oceani]MDN4173349.1 CoA ester lyase [Nocardioides oceani]
MLPRSFLYVPGNRPDLFPKAAAGPADAVVLDLEDAVPLPEKAAAREAVRDRLGSGASAPGSGETWVRVSPTALEDDLDAAVRQGLDGLLLATVTPAAVRTVAALLARLEAERGLVPGSVRVVGLVESAEGLLSLAESAAEERLTAFGIGEVDLLGDLRMSRGPATDAAVTHLRTQVVVHSAAAGLEAPVAPTSTDFRDLDAFAESTRALLDLGFRSRTAVHPAQVPVVHDVLTPTAEQVADARDLVARFDAAEGGVTTDARGRLIDAAVVREAREVLARAERAG